jgi:hypothetical protein
LLDCALERALFEQMKVGHKSKRQSWAGCKVHIAEEPESELITRVEARPANEYDGGAALGW